MCASPLRLLRAGPPPPKVALLPDGLFFTRAVPVTPGATPAEAATQAELALEAASPFPLAQLYYGWFWRPGAELAFVFAAYRRRFTSEQTGPWGEAELVLPAFAAVLGAEVEPATTIVLTSPEEVTAVHWATSAAPSQVVVQPILPDASDEDRARLRENLLRELAGSRKVIDLPSPLAPVGASGDDELIFRSGDFEARLPAATAAALDVRDKGELAARRAARSRDVVMWRVALGALAALVLLGVGELALIGGRAWEKVRVRQYTVQKPVVDKIESVHELTSRIDDLATKRLLPMEMMSEIVGEFLDRKPADILFNRVSAAQNVGLYTLVIEGRTNTPAQVNAYETVVKNLPSVQSAEAKFVQVTSDRATFTLTVVFKPNTLKPISSAVAASQ